MVIEDNTRQKNNKEFLEYRSQSVLLHHRLAHPLDRMAAFIVDLAVLFVFASLLIAPLQRRMQEAKLGDDPQQMVLSGLLIILTLGVLSVLYQFVLNALFGGTLGKLFFGIRVIDIWAGQKLKLTDSFVRAVTWWFDVVLAGLPLFAMYSDPFRRPFHDRVANSLVVSVNARRGYSPDPSEFVVVRGFFVSVYLIGFVLLTGLITQTVKLLEADQNADLISLFDVELCDDVSAVQKDWPLENGLPAQRVSVALALFAAGQVEEDCLNKEAFNEFQSGERHELAYLARAFATSEDSDLSDKYLDKVCELSPESEACNLTRLISLWTDHNWEEASNGFNEALENSSVYVKTWAVKHFEKIRDYKSEMKILDELWPNEGLSEFMASHRTVALWGLDKKSELKVSFQSAVEILPSSKGLGLSGWICYNDLESNCRSVKNQTCKYFDSATEKNTASLSYDLYALTKMKVLECSEKSDYESLELLVEDSRVKKIIQASQYFANDQRQKSVELLLELSENLDESSLLFHETFLRLMKYSTGKELDKQLDRFLETWNNAKPGDLWSWKSFGRHLGAKLIESNRALEGTDVLRSLESKRNSIRLPASVKQGDEE